MRGTYRKPSFDEDRADGAGTSGLSGTALPDSAEAESAVPLEQVIGTTHGFTSPVWGDTTPSELGVDVNDGALSVLAPFVDAENDPCSERHVR